MRYRTFGTSDLRTSEIGFGCARIGGVFQGASRADVIRLIRDAVQQGVTFFDTADMYSQGESERLLGEALSSHRAQVVIATKFGYALPRQGQLVSRIKPLVKPIVARLGLRRKQIPASFRGAVSRQDFSPAYIIAAAEASLKRLKTDYIDVYQLHDPPPEVLRMGEFVQPLEALKQQGKIRHWGVACQQPDDALSSFPYPSLTSIQVGLSVLEQAALDAALPRAAERNLAVIARQVFASGLLTRPVADLQLQDIDHDPSAAARKRELLSAFDAIAERCGRGRAEMAVQFALARHDVSVVLLGISRREHLDAGLRAAQAPALSADERELLNRLSTCP